MKIYNGDYKGNAYKSWTQTTDVDEAIRRLPWGQDKWVLFKYCIIDNHKSSVYKNSPLEKWNRDMMIQLMDKHLSKEDVLKFISENSELIRECYLGAFNVFMEKYGSKTIIDIFAFPLI